MKTASKKDIPAWLPAVIIAALTVTLTSACVPTTPRLDAKFGMAVNTAKAQQVVNPDASLNRDPVKVDGQIGDAMVDNYRDSYLTPRAAGATGAGITFGTGNTSTVGGAGR